MPKPLPAERRDWLTVQEAAAELGIGKNAAYELIRQGRIRCARLGNSIRVHRDWLNPEALDPKDTGRIRRIG